MKKGSLIIMGNHVKINSFVSTLKSKINLFYLLAFVPLVLIAYYHYVIGRSILGVLIPFYGFLLLSFKRDKLSQFVGAGRLQRCIGLVAMSASFFIYYYLVTVFDSSVLYGAGGAFYSLYVLGLFLVFFTVPALKESFSVFFLIVAGGSSFYVGEWLKFYMEPLVPNFVQIMALVLMVLGIPATVHNPRQIMLNTSEGPVPVLFEAGCIGIFSFLVFSVIVVVTMMEELASVRTKLLWSVGGVIGTFIVNIFRVSLISVVVYYFGYERLGEIHSWIGYALFLLWLGFFFMTFSKREAIRNKIRALLQKL